MTYEEFNKRITITLAKKREDDKIRIFKNQVRETNFNKEQLKFNFKIKFWNKLKVTLLTLLKNYV